MADVMVKASLLGPPMGKRITVDCSCGFVFPGIEYMGDYYCPECGMRNVVTIGSFYEGEIDDIRVLCMWSRSGRWVPCVREGPEAPGEGQLPGRL